MNKRDMFNSESRNSNSSFFVGLPSQFALKVSRNCRTFLCRRVNKMPPVASTSTSLGAKTTLRPSVFFDRDFRAILLSDPGLFLARISLDRYMMPAYAPDVTRFSQVRKTISYRPLSVSKFLRKLHGPDPNTTRFFVVGNNSLEHRLSLQAWRFRSASFFHRDSPNYSIS